MTGELDFRTGFFSLRDVQETNSKKTWTELALVERNTFGFLDDIPIVRCGSEQEQLKLVFDFLSNIENL